MTCGLCGAEFDVTDADTACGRCPLVRECHLVRCPCCGYEMPPEAKLIGWWRKRRQRQAAQADSSPME